MPEASRIDEFAFVLLAGIILIVILTVSWSTLYAGAVEVTPTEKTLTIARGSSATFTIRVNGTATNVNLTGSGDVAEWLSFDRNNFDVSGSPVDVHATVTVPLDAQLKYYTGNVNVEFVGGKKTISLTINVSTVTVTETTHRVFGPEDFAVSYSVGTETVAEKKSFTVEKGLFTDSSARFSGTLSSEKLSMVTGGFIDITIDDTNSEGNLIVEFNGQEVFNDKAEDRVSVDLEKSQIQKTNRIIVKAESPGWRFWVNNYYEIGSAKFGIDYEGISFKDFTFTLDSNDISNFKLGRLSFRVRDYDPSKLNDMIIKINNQVVFRGVPTLTYFSRSFGTEIPLSIGTNTISFSVDREAYYDLSDVILTIVRNV
jgi:hypothetical protein